jgi:hypothetical protein
LIGHSTTALQPVFIAQAIYFATFVSLLFHPRQEKFDARLKDVISVFFTYFKIPQL